MYAYNIIKCEIIKDGGRERASGFDLRTTNLEMEFEVQVDFPLL